MFLETKDSSGVVHKDVCVENEGTFYIAIYMFQVGLLHISEQVLLLVFIQLLDAGKDFINMAIDFQFTPLFT